MSNDLQAELIRARLYMNGDVNGAFNALGHSMIGKQIRYLLERLDKMEAALEEIADNSNRHTWETLIETAQTALTVSPPADPPPA